MRSELNVTHSKKWKAPKLEFLSRIQYTKCISLFKQIHEWRSGYVMILWANLILLVLKLEYFGITRPKVWMDNQIVDVTQSADEMYLTSKVEIQKRHMILSLIPSFQSE